ncbi:MAG TPA: hypothetical protein VFX98_17725 [Longimicrobiaceae bacterium]|nr:hypothetical protein [Longimicrobiaceae bacterium]
MHLPPSPRCLVLLALAVLAACGGEDEPESPPLPPGVEALPAGARIAMPPAREHRCQPPSMRDVFREAPEWNGYWSFGLPEGCPRPELPAGFDFAREMVVFVSMGPRSSPVDSISIVGSGVVNDSVVVYVRRTTRQNGCPTEKAEVYPRDLARIPADTLPVKFLEEHRKLPCAAGP